MEIPLPSVQKLIQEFTQFPGIGPRTAQRLAYFFLKLPENEAQEFIQALQNVRLKVKTCQQCYGYTEEDVCSICRDPERDSALLCVVETPHDVFLFENLQAFKGKYHVLRGVLSPLDGIGPNQLTIQALFDRIEKEPVREVIFALPPTVQGEATMVYIQKHLKKYPITITRLAAGLPIGSDLEYVDSLTLLRAFQYRTEVGD